VLPHCRAVVSHAGAGTMLGACARGLPRLSLSQGTDQPFNTAALLPTGARTGPPPEEISANTVGDVFGRLLDEPSFRHAAGRLRAEIDQLPTRAAVLREVLADPDR
jgi:UDP:flavonoid glycosyltransferase YjiC (YdhE family)